MEESIPLLLRQAAAAVVAATGATPTPPTPADDDGDDDICVGVTDVACVFLGLKGGGRHSPLHAKLSPVFPPTPLHVQKEEQWGTWGTWRRGMITD